MNNSTSDISNQTRGFDIGSTIFFYEKGRCSVFPSMRLTPNIRKFFSYLFGISALENNTEHLTSFLKIFRSPTVLGSAQAL
jgi:outer membrane scaffolding protein for murein synthesis (MipA/OmpV family)